MTPHISANKGDIAKTVIMPGDPRRAKFIAENYLENAKLVNEVRNIFAYTGTYKGKEVTVMASGMGMPSIAIYSYELFNFYEVDTIIRLGSCKALKEHIKLKDVILAESAYTTSNFAHSFTGENQQFIKSDETINEKVKATAKSLDILVHTGTINTSDIFYTQYEETNEEIEKCIGVEMESFGLFKVAEISNKKASAVLTVSDNIDVTEILTPEEREKNLNTAIKLVLESII